jgi:hypothetical protein
MPLLSAREATWLELVGARNLPGISSCNALWSNHLWGQRCGLGPGVVVRPGGGGQLVPSQLNCTAVRLVPLVSSAACLLCSLMSFHCEPFVVRRPGRGTRHHRSVSRSHLGVPCGGVDLKI